MFAATLRQAMARLADLPCDITDVERVDRLRLLEELKCAAEAAQAQLSAALDESQQAAQRAAGVREERVGGGVAAQIGLARRESPFKAARLLGLAKILAPEMPHTLALMTKGQLSERRAIILARETACLSLADRLEVDRRLCATGKAAELGDRALADAARKLAYTLDGESFVARARKSETERAVTIRPAPDTMTYVTALLPVKDGVSVYAALKQAATTATAVGDPRGHGQLMADTLVERVTGRAAPDPPPVEIRLLMTDRALLDGGSEAAVLPGYGVLPAAFARDLATKAAQRTTLWLRRLYTTPGTGRVVAMDSQRRLAPPGLAALIDTRDQGLCRTPWCGAPIRHIDHVVEHQFGGPTSEANLQGLCLRCNLAKQATGWANHPRPGPRHTVLITTPTGHQYQSRAPDPPGSGELVLTA
jgi:hypothetical protein